MIFFKCDTWFQHLMVKEKYKEYTAIGKKLRFFSEMVAYFSSAFWNLE